MSYRIPVHGRLMREGRPVTGAADLLLRVYAIPAGGEAMWEAMLPGVECGEDGAFRIVAGEEPPLALPPGFEPVSCWLEIRQVVGGEEPVLLPATGPRLPLAPLLLDARLAAMEAQIAALLPVRRRLARLRRRLRQPPAVEALAARVERIGEELEELVGKDGDIVDLYERVERLEGRGPLAREGLRVEERLTDLARRLGIAEQILGPLQVEGGLLRRAGDQMSGPLRVPRLIAEAVEAREVVVEGRPLSVRQVEGRQSEGRAGAGKKDAALLLNARSGAEVAVGREGGAGLRVHGLIRGAHAGIGVERLPAAGLPADPIGLCLRFGPEGLALTGRAGDPGLVGVCLRVAEGEAEILVRGRGAVLVRGPIAAGTRLGGGDDGYACPLPEGAPGRALGWAVAAARNTDQGWSVEALISPG